MTPTEIIGARGGDPDDDRVRAPGAQGARLQGHALPVPGHVRDLHDRGLLWGAYGYLRDDWVIVMANAITAVLCLAILVVKLRNDVFGNVNR